MVLWGDGKSRGTSFESLCGMVGDMESLDGGEMSCTVGNHRETDQMEINGILSFLWTTTIFILGIVD